MSSLHTIVKRIKRSERRFLCCYTSRIKNLNNIIIIHLNFNSLPNKFGSLTSNMNIDIIVLTETKLNGSHPTSVLIEGY